MEGLVWPVGSSYSRRPPQTRGQWGLKLLLFFGPKRQDDKDSIPLGLLTPGCTAEVVDMEGGWRGGVGVGAWAGVLYRKLILWNFLLIANGDFVAFALLSGPGPQNASVSLNSG